MESQFFAGTEDRMKKAVETVRKNLSTIRSGRASPALLEKVMVECYGTTLSIREAANLSTPDAKTLLVSPFDRANLPHIEKAILKSETGLTPTNDGNVIRINIPALTEERRKEMVKLAKKETEEGKVAIRNIRRDSNDEIKKAEKDKKISEDQSRRDTEQVQKLTDKYLSEIDKAMEAKEKEILQG